jgi:hypothetical protein
LQIYINVMNLDILEINIKIIKIIKINNEHLEYMNTSMNKQKNI